jgi:2-oxoglutarate dehydrogenase E1 component
MMGSARGVVELGASVCHLMDTFDFAARASPEYVDALYRAYRQDPGSVDERWALVFAGYEFGLGSRAAGPEPGRAVADLVHAYRTVGYLAADVDPLDRTPRSHLLLQLEHVGLTEADLDRPVEPGAARGVGTVPLRDLLAVLRETYCGPLGVESVAIDDKAQREWLQERMEPSRNRPGLPPDEQRALLKRLIEAEAFERFLQARFVGQKRFSLEGGETLISLLDTIVAEAAASGVEEMVLGMPHRGRLNVLAHVMAKPYEMILAEFEGSFLPWDVQGDGDVKYHLGYSHDHDAGDGHRIHLSMSPNPSHLEVIDPVVEGIVRAKQAYRGDRERKRVVPVLLHGDAAFMGQGSVYETLMLAQLPGFTTGGTVHVIINNQIGFTTDPVDYRPGRYPSEPARVIRAPVFHVNGDHPEAVVQAGRLATGFRQTFGVDAFVDLVCYRRHGHNELDDPSLTQPLLYATVQSHPSVAELYGDRLERAGVVDARARTELRQAAQAGLEQALTHARERMPRQKVFVFGGVWQGLGWAGADWSAETAVKADRLRSIADSLRHPPTGFTPHPRVKRLLDERAQMVERGQGIDWGCAETLAYGSLLLEGVPVRVCGQDTVRGTFGHRHAAVFDVNTGRAWVPLQTLSPDQAAFDPVNSPLSELAVLGFEYGMSSADPRRLVVWEAQFGDFVNGAQIIVDQFIASAESKWQRMSGVVLLLPHGYEGQGPEHSSARLERFLQLCAEDNLQVVNPTTPAQLFHVLRRQMHRRFRKPLIVMSPKSLLRHTRSLSALPEFTEGGFRAVLDDPRELDASAVDRLLLCSGKVYYALDVARDDRDWKNVAVVRVEQLYPWPEEELAATLRRYPRAREYCWVQEEPANQGAWEFVEWRLGRLVGGTGRPRYIGRPESASPATGSYRNHQSEEDAIVEAALRRPRPERVAR